MADNWIGRILMTDETEILNENGEVIHDLIPCNQGAGVVVDNVKYPKLSAKLGAGQIPVNNTLLQTINENLDQHSYFGGTGDQLQYSATGEQLVVSSFYWHTSFGEYLGKVWGYKRTSTGNYVEQWSASSTLPTTPDPRFGTVISSSADCTVTAVAQRETAPDGDGEWAVSILDDDGAVLQIMTDPDGDGLKNQFGEELAVSGDGKTILIGTGDYDGIKLCKVFTYKHDGTDYKLVDTWSNSATRQWLSISDDGNTVVWTSYAVDLIPQLLTWNGTGYSMTDIGGSSTMSGRPLLTGKGDRVIISSHTDSMVMDHYNISEGQATYDKSIDFSSYGDATRIGYASLSKNGQFMAFHLSHTSKNTLYCHHWDESSSSWVLDQTTDETSNGTHWGYPETSDMGEVVVAVSRGTVPNLNSGHVEWYGYMASITAGTIPDLTAPSGIVGTYKIIADGDVEVTSPNPNPDPGGEDGEVSFYANFSDYSTGLTLQTSNGTWKGVMVTGAVTDPDRAYMGYGDIDGSEKGKMGQPDSIEVGDILVGQYIVETGVNEGDDWSGLAWKVRAIGGVDNDTLWYDMLSQPEGLSTSETEYGFFYDARFKVLKANSIEGSEYQYYNARNKYPFTP